MQYPFADGHCDFLAGVRARGYDIAHPAPGQQIALPYLQEGNVRLQFFAMWPFPRAPKSAREQCLEMFSDYEAMLAAHPVFSPLTPDFDPSGEGIATVLTIEGGEAIEQDLGLLHDFFQKGVRALTLTWNYPNGNWWQSHPYLLSERHRAPRHRAGFPGTHRVRPGSRPRDERARHGHRCLAPKRRWDRRSPAAEHAAHLRLAFQCARALPAQPLPFRRAHPCHRGHGRRRGRQLL